MENQLLTWGNLHRLNKKLRLRIANYIDGPGRVPSGNHKAENLQSPMRSLLNGRVRLMPSVLSVNIQLGGMCTESCDVLVLHAATKDNIAGGIPTGKSTINYDGTI